MWYWFLIYFFLIVVIGLLIFAAYKLKDRMPSFAQQPNNVEDKDSLVSRQKEPENRGHPNR